MILAFLVVLAASLFPINLISSSWGSQISSRILDAGVLPMIGVTLLRSAFFWNQAWIQGVIPMLPACSVTGSHPGG
jgi:hypothetical protein